jgi:hypothetical protein
VGYFVAVNALYMRRGMVSRVLIGHALDALKMVERALGLYATEVEVCEKS